MKEQINNSTTITTTTQSKICSNFIIRKKISFSKKLNKYFDVILFDNWEESKTVPILIAFPDIGITPIITSSSLIEQLNLAQIGLIKSISQAASATIKDGQPSHSIRIFGNKKIIIINSDNKIKKEKHIHSIIDSIIKITHIFESKLIYSTEGVPVETVEKIERKEMHNKIPNNEFEENDQSVMPIIESRENRVITHI